MTETGLELIKKKQILLPNTKVFTPNPREISLEEEKKIYECLDKMQCPIITTESFTKKEISSAITKYLNAKKAPGYDLITGRILKELPASGLLYLTQLFNAILRTGLFPPQWKVAQIIMIQKPNKDPTDVKSYRPISLLSILSKLFEKLLLQRLMPAIEAKHLIPYHQFGFRRKHATIEQVHRITNKITSALETKKYCSAAFLDISRAFDKVWHDGLLYKIQQNLPENFHTILKSYLHNRYFFIKQQDAITEIQQIHSGVPQGSVLGPVLYLLYTADLPTNTNVAIATFADDTAVLAISNDPTMASQHLQNNLNLIQKWLKAWRIKANEAKSIQVTFTTRTKTCPPVYLNEIQIPQANDAKYLGMHLDRRLNWRKHIFSKRKQLGLKLSKMYWLVGRKSQLSLENKLLIYKTILKPIWTYGIQLWGTASNSNIEILQRFQSKVLRIITDAPWYVTNEILHRDLKVPTVKETTKEYCLKYRDRLEEHPSRLVVGLMRERRTVRRLKRKIPSDLLK